MKEAAGAITGDKDKKAEGRAQQRKDAAKEKAAQKERTAEWRRELTKLRELDREHRKGKGSLGDLTDTFSGR